MVSLVKLWTRSHLLEEKHVAVFSWPAKDEAHSLQSIPHENIAELEIRDSSQSQILRLDDAGYAIGLDFWIFFCNRQ
ncbi:hypothetical protein HID58_074065 [Brassica napus]|uniref:Uncharacterized protein n=1 Tax=Brassica napus TaxID=3708 RepID=A0ABQ7YIC0_BRANA|nr:hypothetical protein HID58_074065 [Brassica napus]